MEPFILFVIIQASNSLNPTVEAAQMEFGGRGTCEYAKELLIREKAKDFYKFDAFCLPK